MDTDTAFRPDRGWIPYQRATGVVTTAGLGLPLLVVALVLWMDGELGRRALAVVLALAVVVWAIRAVIWPPLLWRATRYRLGEDVLEVRSGVLWRSVTTVPLLRIQHIDVLNGPLQRTFGIATLLVHTPGTRYAVVPLPGLAQARAEALRDRLLPRHEHA